MQIKPVILFSCLVLSLSAAGQSLTNKELYRLDSTIRTYLYSVDTPVNDRSSELLVLVIMTDSVGKLSSLRFLADENQDGVTHNLLQRMDRNLFSGWQSAKAFNKCILIPYYSMGYQQETNYADRVFNDFLRALQRPYGVRSENGDIITTAPLLYTPPYNKERDPHTPGRFKIIDTLSRH